MAGSTKKLFTLSTNAFLPLWAKALKDDATWDQFVDSVMKNNSSDGVAKDHADYFASPNGKASLKSQLVLYREYMGNQGSPLARTTGLDDKKLLNLVKTYFYSDKCLAKCNALRANNNFAKVPKPDGWKNRTGVKKGGGGPKVNWDERVDMFKDLMG